jgi:hypothetical protein
MDRGWRPDVGQKPFGKFAELVVPLGMLSLRRIFANPGPRLPPERALAPEGSCGPEALTPWCYHAGRSH